ncbi:MAG TPA: FAD-dependent oxidoreductase [Gemmatimonadaceae bacterium]|nr:FAD-dependent oxidoreductase [Gemmatimonadaceae bacterium]
MIDAPTGRSAAASTDVLVIGDGVIGLSIAVALARAGVACVVAGGSRPGAASMTAGGLLAPSVGRVAAPAQAFYDASLALYPAFVDSLREFDPELRMIEGLLVVRAAQAAAVDPTARELAPAQAAALEPALVAPHGAAFYAGDGAVDNERLTRAARAAAVALLGPARVLADDVARVEPGPHGVAVTTASGARIEAGTVVLAAGAWVSHIAGLPRAIPVEPVKGQMIALASAPLHHAVIGNGVYVVPRGGETLVGSTLERTGFDTSTDTATADRLHAAAAVLCPTLGDAPRSRAWAGLRPGTPDMLPIIGRDPEFPSVVYACGHSKNGILLAPATAAAVAAMIGGHDSGLDLAPFAIERFSSN